MFQMDESAIQIPQESGADVWQNGRTGEMANFAVFKVYHTQDGSGRIHYQMEREGVAIAPNPFTGRVEKYTFILSPPMGSRPKSAKPAGDMPNFGPKPQYAFWEDWGVILGFVGGLLFWVATIYWLWRLVCR
ncbi:MAG: hypothetical protein IT327_02750 [Anaerolineae bacterium]|nr:hypothetical protein [Anaerolineae bacterium]